MARRPGSAGSPWSRWCGPPGGFPATTCCPRPRPTCCAGWSGTRRRLPRTSEPWPWLRARRIGATCGAASPRCDRRPVRRAQRSKRAGRGSSSGRIRRSDPLTTRRSDHGDPGTGRVRSTGPARPRRAVAGDSGVPPQRAGPVDVHRPYPLAEDRARPHRRPARPRRHALRARGAGGDAGRRPSGVAAGKRAGAAGIPCRDARAARGGGTRAGMGRVRPGRHRARRGARGDGCRHERLRRDGGAPSRAARDERLSRGLERERGRRLARRRRSRARGRRGRRTPRGRRGRAARRRARPRPVPARVPSRIADRTR